MVVDLSNEHSALDISHARTVLGWKQRRSLRETLPVIVPRSRSTLLVSRKRLAASVVA